MVVYHASFHDDCPRSTHTELQSETEAEGYCADIRLINTSYSIVIDMSYARISRYVIYIIQLTALVPSVVKSSIRERPR